MNPSLTNSLCTRCGLCCDGSLFADVELAGTAEATTLEVMGLEIEDAEVADGALLLQPCAALKGKRCSVYPHRPECCRTFECRLLQEVRRGSVEIVVAKARVAETLKQIERVKKLVGQLGQSNQRLPLKERCVEALANSEEASVHPRLKRKRAELEIAITSMDHLLRETFLDGGKKRRRLTGRSETHRDSELG